MEKAGVLPTRVYAIFAAFALLGAISLTLAVGWYGHPFANVLLDRDAHVSSVGSPEWDRQGLNFPDRVVSVDGEDLVHPRGEYAVRDFDRAVDRASAAGRPSVHVRVEARSGARELDLAIRRFGALDWWVLAGIPGFAACLYVIVALTALVASPRGKLARTFAKTALLCALFLFTMFETHTTRALVPLSDVAFAMAPFAFVGLALRLPDDAPILVRYPRLLGLLDLIGLGIASSMVLLGLAHRSTIAIRDVCGSLLAAGLLFFVVTFVVRLLRAKDERREVMRALVAALAPAHLLLAIGIILAKLSASTSGIAFFIVVPALTLTPLSAVVAFIRNDLWGSRALVSRMVTLTATAAVACTIALMLGAAFATWRGVPFRDALVGAGAGALASAALVTLALRLIDRGFFPARTEYKPTIDQLSESLTSVRRPDEVGRAVERMVRRWLACEYVRFEADDVDTQPAAEGELKVPVTFGGERAATLRIGRKRGAALFTSDDMDLLRTIANQAALALAYATSYAELEERRRHQEAAWRGERAALVETIAAEIVHEAATPINFFRSVFRRRHAPASLDAEEVEIGCEEIDRLDRLVSGLKRLGQPRLERREASLRDLLSRTELLLRDALGVRVLDVDIPRDVTLRCDPDQATQILVNLVANALDAAGERGRVGVRFRVSNGAGTIIVWDTGGGFAHDPAQLFAPWFTTKPRGTGLGLAITQRIVRAHGWRIDAHRIEGITEFVVLVPAADLLAPEGPAVGSDQSLGASGQISATSSISTARNY